MARMNGFSGGLSGKQKNLPSVTTTRSEEGAQAVIDLKDVQLTNSEIDNEIAMTAEPAQDNISISMTSVGNYDRIVFVGFPRAGRPPRRWFPRAGRPPR